jgi:hypothetical protein
MSDPGSDPGGEVLRGGVNVVRRVGDTVRRPVGPWTPAVHALLRHVAAAGFTGAPRVHGIDAGGREILDFLPGEVGDAAPAGEAAVAAAGRLLRAYHDATAGFVAPPDARWYLPPREPAEVICHGDAATYNCVFRGGLPVAWIDFDTAHPGPRVWDAAYTAYRFVPLSAGGGAGGEVRARAARLREFLDGYGDGLGGPARVLDVAAERLRTLVDHMRRRAAAGDEAFRRHLADGHDRLYLADTAYIEANAVAIVDSMPA